MASERRGATRYDVAKLAGVSPAAVSLVLNGRAKEARLSDETTQRVLAAARELHYFPNGAARALAQRRHRTIGVIASRPREGAHMPVFEEFASAVIERAAGHEHFVTFLPSVSPLGGYDALTTLRGAAIDGVIIHGSENIRRIGETLVQAGLPVVGVDVRNEQNTPSGIGVVAADQYMGGLCLARHLVHYGHTSIGILVGPGQEPPRWGARFRGFLHGLPSDVQVEIAVLEDWLPRSGDLAMRDLLGRALGLTAVFAGTDLIAAGAMQAIRAAGLGIPNDIAVAGFGDFRLSQYLDPPLTTVHWPVDELGSRAVDLLIAQLSRPQESNTPIILPTELVVRASTASTPRGATPE